MEIGRRRYREANEIALQYQTRREGMLQEELAEENLTQLLVFVSQLDHTPPGVDELQRRRKLFGECQRTEDETSGEFYGRLHHWLDRDLTQTKSPVQASSQTDNY